MNASFHQIIANDFTNLGGLMEGATEFLESQGVDAQAVFRINLTLEEIVTNIIKFAHDPPTRHSIEVTLDVGTQEVKAVISHEGYEFNPVLHERQQPAERLIDRDTGGLGIYLIKKLLGSMSYRREGARNIVEITTARKPARASS